MPLALIIALAGSLAIHAAILFGPRIVLPGEDEALPPLRAELQPPPKAPAKPAKPAARRAVSPAPAKPPAPVAPVAPASLDELLPPGEDGPAAESPPALDALEQAGVAADAGAGTSAAAPAPVNDPGLPASGAIRFVIYKESLGLPVGRAEHRWEFTADGHYRLSNETRTSGLVAVFKPLVVRAESRGRLVAGGLLPEHYRTWKNGVDNREGADFDWARRQVHLVRNDRTLSIEDGAQDLLSLTYQLGYLERPEAGNRIGLVGVRKYEHYQLESLGEEDVELPAGRFHTLHLRARSDTTTEIWIALDLHRLPVKIRYTDRQGDSYLQLATEIGMSDRPAAP